jgi:hypothetical protein
MHVGVGLALAAIACAMTACAYAPERSGSGSNAGTDARRKPITVAAANVTDDLADFPLWIDLEDPQIGAIAQPDGSDVAFTDASGEPIPFEIQRWTPGSGRLQAWVKVELLAGVDTVIYVRYGDGTPAPAPAPASVFSSGFAGVWHMEDALTTTQVVDATGSRTGTATSLDASRQVTAKLGGGIDFSGTTAERIQFSNPLSGNSDHTMSAWVSQRTARVSEYDAIIVLGNGAPLEPRWFYTRFQTNLAVGFYGGSNNRESGTPIDDEAFTLLHWVYEAGSRTGTLFRNGVEVDVHTFPIAPNTQGADGYLGYGPIQFGNVAMNGILDEVRIATMVRSAEWISAEFANQASPSTFYTVGPEERTAPDRVLARNETKSTRIR